MNKNDKFIPFKQVHEKYGVSNSTLKKWEKDGKIEAIKSDGKKRFYSVNSLEKLFKLDEKKKKERRKVCYARVSSQKQKNDLDRQINDLKSKYPTHEIIKDIGSGVNFKRKGFCSLVESIIDGDIEELVVSYKDRLCRFGFDFIERICKKTGCEIVVLNKNDGSTEFQDLADDLLSIVTVFTAKNNGLRSAENRKKRKANARLEKETKRKKESDKKGSKQDEEDSDISES